MLKDVGIVVQNIRETRCMQQSGMKGMMDAMHNLYPYICNECTKVQNPRRHEFMPQT